VVTKEKEWGRERQKNGSEKAICLCLVMICLRTHASFVLFLLPTFSPPLWKSELSTAFGVSQELSTKPSSTYYPSASFSILWRVMVLLLFDSKQLKKTIFFHSLVLPPFLLSHAG